MGTGRQHWRTWEEWQAWTGIGKVMGNRMGLGAGRLHTQGTHTGDRRKLEGEEEWGMGKGSMG